MITRKALAAITDALNRQAAVTLIGPRQVGKTTTLLVVFDERTARRVASIEGYVGSYRRMNGK